MDGGGEDELTTSGWPRKECLVPKPRQNIQFWTPGTLHREQRVKKSDQQGIAAEARPPSPASPLLAVRGRQYLARSTRATVRGRGCWQRIARLLSKTKRATVIIVRMPSAKREHAQVAHARARQMVDKELLRKIECTGTEVAGMRPKMRMRMLQQADELCSYWRRNVLKSMLRSPCASGRNASDYGDRNGAPISFGAH